MIGLSFLMLMADHGNKDGELVIKETSGITRN